MNTSMIEIEGLLRELPEKDQLRLAERVFAEAGIASVLPRVYSGVGSLPSSEAQALASVGLRVSAKTQERAESARGQYISTFVDLFEQADTPAELAGKLNLDPSRIRQRIRERTLLSIELNGEKRVPWFQFAPVQGRHVEVPGLAKVLTRVDEKLSPLAFSMWFLTSTAELPMGEEDIPASPREWLLQTGDVDTVLELAKEL